MLTGYLLPVQTALWVFPFVALLFVLPAAIMGYRRRGRAGGWSALLFYSFVFYLLAALLQTMMPLPTDIDAHCTVANYSSGGPQLEPLHFARTVSQGTAGDWSPQNLVSLTSTWTSLFNLLLLLPLGVYLRYYMRQGLLGTTAVALGTSLFFETTQLTGLWFVYTCPYRQFNVDDLLLNTLGAVLGWLVAGRLGHRLPAIAPDRERARYGSRVTLPRRFLAYLTDLLGWLVGWTLVTGLVVAATDTTTGREFGMQAGTVLGLAWFWLVPAAFGTTPGKRVVRLRIMRPDGSRPGPFRTTVRCALLHAPLALGWLLLAERTGMVALPDRAEWLLLAALLPAFVLVWVWSPLAALLRGDGRAPYERASGTVNRAVLSRRERGTATSEEPSADGVPKQLSHEDTASGSRPAPGP
ncbi:VanZ family protein [Streptomyces sp. ACA25]|uniref:VanZ family protein n=1 Tax=Streptomyces sp. ACA25 TaxID=3022596 RepID=UPI002307CB9A|nr:VanZ family protein [Streptomyces sp. ACA25]MDB1087271.1 VanZ family protein [Streptomyces sp. ACA25]